MRVTNHHVCLYRGQLKHTTESAQMFGEFCRQLIFRSCLGDGKFSWYVKHSEWFESIHHKAGKKAIFVVQTSLLITMLGDGSLTPTASIVTTKRHNTLKKSTWSACDQSTFTTTFCMRSCSDKSSTNYCSLLDILNYSRSTGTCIIPEFEPRL